jgi:hypothetical protein
MDDSFRRNHLRLRFMLTVLRLDPNVYKVTASNTHVRCIVEQVLVTQESNSGSLV